MANLWLRTLDSMTMNSEEHSEVFVDANDQRDWPVDDSVEAFMQARFRVLSMPHDEVQRNLSILRRRFSPHADDSSATLGALSALSGESTCLLRWIPLPHTFCLCHPRTDLRQCRLFVWHRLLQSPLPDLMRRIHRILRATSRLLPRDSALLL